METNIYNLIPILYDKYIVFMLVFTRISSMFATFTLFRRDYVSPRILIALTALLSLIVVILSPGKTVQLDPVSLQAIMLMVFQVFVGFVTGFILNIVFEIFSAVGQIIAMQIGISMASLIDPRFGSITVLSHLYVFTITIIFFLTDGHLYLIKIIMNSFTILPCDHAFLSTKFIPNLLNYSGIIFSQAALLSIIVIIAAMLSNLAMGVMSKFAPQFNIFSLGININLIVGLILVYITFDLYTMKGISIVHNGLVYLQHTIAKMR